MTSKQLNQVAKAVDDIVKDLADRRGLKSEWNQIDDDIQEEIVLAWRRIIVKHMDTR